MQLFHNDILSDEEYLGQAKLDADGNPVAIPGPSDDWLIKQLRISYVLRILRKSQLTIEWMLAHSGEEKNVVGGFVETNPDISEFSASIMELMNQEVIRSGAEFAFFVIPSKYRLYDQNRDYAGLEFADKWKAWATDNGINFIDFVKPFRDQVSIGDRPFFERDIHFNENGHAIAAMSILRFIEQHSKQNVFPTVRR